MYVQSLHEVLGGYDFLISFHQQSDIAISYEHVLKVPFARPLHQRQLPQATSFCLLCDCFHISA